MYYTEQIYRELDICRFNDDKCNNVTLMYTNCNNVDLFIR